MPHSGDYDLNLWPLIFINFKKRFIATFHWVDAASNCYLGLQTGWNLNLRAKLGIFLTI